jgi:formyltetrahydrofolate deformylase
MRRSNGMQAHRLVIVCPDRHGIVAAVSRHLFDAGANIVSSDQHSTDPEGGTFYMRQEFRLDGLDREAFERDFATAVGEPLEMDWRLSLAGERKRMAILVSCEDHCLLDLLWRVRRGELAADVAMVISNHPHHDTDVASFGVPFEHVPWPAEQGMLALLAAQVDLIVLARYMRILSADFLERAGAPVINIHHSFLPAFAGADPYARARERGVKIIGATAHYVTEELDAGPIIAQDVAHVTHRDDVDALTRIGRDIERTVLARAVRLHLDDRVLVHAGTTVVF